MVCAIYIFLEKIQELQKSPTFTLLHTLVVMLLNVIPSCESFSVIVISIVVVPLVVNVLVGEGVRNTKRNLQ